MIQLKSISKTYDTFKALDDVTINVEKGEFVSLVGHSGSGKSTILNLIGLIDIPTKGEIFISGNDISKKSENEKSYIRNKEIGFIFQDFYLEPLYSVLKNIELPLLIRGVNKNERKSRALDMLSLVNLESKAYVNASTLSGGEKQRIAIARALISEPNIILADEPTGNLDSQNSNLIMEFLKKANKEGKTLLLVTHNLEEAKLADRIIKIKDGKIEK